MVEDMFCRIRMEGGLHVNSRKANVTKEREVSDSEVGRDIALDIEFRIAELMPLGKHFISFLNSFWFKKIKLS